MRSSLKGKSTQSTLESFCHDRKVPFVVDPTNRNLNYARNAIRHTLQEVNGSMDTAQEASALIQQALSYDEMAPLLGFFDRYRNMMENETRRLTSSILTVDPDLGAAFISIQPRQCEWFANQHIAVRLLAKLVAWASPTLKPVRQHRIVELYRKIADQLYHGIDFKPSTTANCIVVPPPNRRSAIWAIAREPLSQSRRRFLPLVLDEALLWDSRFRIKLTAQTKSGSDENIEQTLFKTYLRQTEGLVDASISQSTLVSSRFCVSQLAQVDIHYLQRARRPILSQRDHIALKHFLQTMPVISRFTIPAIYWEATTSTGHILQQLISVPSLGVNLKSKFLRIDCEFVNGGRLFEDVEENQKAEDDN